MFRRLNLYLFAGFVLSLKMAVMIALIIALVLAAFTPFTGGEFLVTAIPMIAGLAAAFGFLSTLAAFFFVNTLKLWGFKFERSIEGYWVLSIAALSTNVWFLLNFERNFVGLYIAIFVFSLLAIFLGNKIFQNTMTKLDGLLVE